MYNFFVLLDKEKLDVVDDSEEWVWDNTWELVGFWKNMSESVPLQRRERINFNVSNSYDMLPFKLNIIHKSVND